MLVATLRGECPLGAIQGLKGDCYVYGVSEAATWLDADAACAKMGAQLAYVVNTMENAVIGDFPSIELLDEYWLGGTFNRRVQGWMWSDGSPICYANWADGEPQNSTNMCLSFGSASRRWYARDCLAEKPYICKWSPPKPKAPTESCAEGWTHVNGTEKCYKVVIGFEHEAYDTLWDKCEKLGGKPASIHSAMENAALVVFVSESIPQEFKTEIHDFFLGLYSSDGGLTWQWRDGSPVDYNNWDKGYPRTNKDTEDKCGFVVVDGAPNPYDVVPKETAYTRWTNIHCAAVNETSTSATLCQRNLRH